MVTSYAANAKDLRISEVYQDNEGVLRYTANDKPVGIKKVKYD